MDEDILLPINAENYSQRTPMPTKLKICGLMMMWIASSALSFAIGYHIEKDDCPYMTNDGSNI